MYGHICMKGMSRRVKKSLDTIIFFSHGLPLLAIQHICSTTYITMYKIMQLFAHILYIIHMHHACTQWVTSKCQQLISLQLQGVKIHAIVENVSLLFLSNIVICCFLISLKLESLKGFERKWVSSMRYPAYFSRRQAL